MIRTRKQRGFTMLELMIAVGVISIATIATLGFYQRVSSAQTAEDVRKQVLTVQTAVKELYPDPNRTGLTSAGLIAAQKIPAAMVNGTTIVSKYGSAITVVPGNLAGGIANSGYSITLAGVEPRDCATLTVGMAAAFPYISVNGYVYKSSTVTTSTPANAATFCAASTTPSIILAAL